MKSRLIVAGILLGLAAIVVVPVLVFQFGRSDPSPPALEDKPNVAIPGELLYFDEDGCVVRAKASGAGTMIATCDIASSPASFVTWLDGHTIAVAASFPGKVEGQFAVTTYDLETGARGEATVTETGLGFPFGPVQQESVNGERVSISETGEVTLLAGSRKTEVAQFDVARYRGPHFLTWSPDGEWMALAYYDDRAHQLWILSRDGQTSGTLARGLRQPVVSWYIEGAGAWPKVDVRR